MELESVAPLSAASNLSFLTLDRCHRPASAPHRQFRVELPPLPSLTELEIEDPEGLRLTAAQAAALNLPLFQRLPKLRPDSFSQNLLFSD
jgi:hypothetical protein